MAPDDTAYEMMWDCPYCGTEHLLGLTHRHCPSCGAPQDPTKRYFPPEGDEVAVADHVFTGADKRCPSCDTPNSAAATFCMNCGTPLAEAQAVGTVDDRTPVPEPPAPDDGSGARTAKGCLIGCLGIIVLFAVVLGVYMSWTKEAQATVTGHTWERSIEVERFDNVTDSDWRDRMPMGAEAPSCRLKKRDTRKVADGEDCTTVKVDQGDGTFRKEDKCTTRYRSEDVMDEWCTYRIDKWVTDRTARTSGDALMPTPTWPAVEVDDCRRVGCTREGSRAESYTVHFDVGEGGDHVCVFDEATWRRFAAGSTYTATLRVMDSSLVCDSLSGD